MKSIGHTEEEEEEDEQRIKEREENKKEKKITWNKTRASSPKGRDK